LEPLHPAQAGRGREVDALGQFGVAEAAFALQFGQQLDVDPVEGFAGGHGGFRWPGAMILRRKPHAWQQSQPSCGAKWLESMDQALFAHEAAKTVRPTPGVPMSAQMPTAPRRLENIHTDKGKVP